MTRRRRADADDVPDLEAWVASGKSLLDYPLTSGKRLGDATRPELLEEARLAGLLEEIYGRRAAELRKRILPELAREALRDCDGDPERAKQRLLALIESADGLAEQIMEEFIKDIIERGDY